MGCVLLDVVERHSTRGYIPLPIRGKPEKTEKKETTEGSQKSQK